MAAHKVPIEIRFAQKWELNSDGCHVWTAGKTKDGYGKIDVEGRDQMAHRVAWFLHYGQWPELTLDHLCRNRACVNVHHLEDVSSTINTHRGKNRSARPDPTKCAAGLHDWIPENWAKKEKRCRLCFNNAARMRYQVLHAA